MEKYIKYPRTYHLPWSLGCTDDDKILQDTSFFEGRRVIITEKMDGENTTMYSDHIHARSLDGNYHHSRAWIKNLHGQICHLIPPNWRICGENLYAQHSLRYENLPTYFMVFSVWDRDKICFSWDETVTYAEALELTTVPVIFDGLWDEQKIRKLSESMDLTRKEGYVVRLADAFSSHDFDKCVAKFVRKQHVSTTEHWMTSKIIKNGLASADQA